VGRSLFRRLPDLTALDHHRPFEPRSLQFLEDASEINFALAKLNHHVAFYLAAIFGAKARDVAGNRFNFSNGVFAGVVNDVTRIVPDREVAMIHLFYDL